MNDVVGAQRLSVGLPAVLFSSTHVRCAPFLSTFECLVRTQLLMDAQEDVQVAVHIMTLCMLPVNLLARKVSLRYLSPAFPAFRSPQSTIEESLLGPESQRGNVGEDGTAARRPVS